MNAYAKLLTIVLLVFISANGLLAETHGFKPATEKALRQARRGGKPVVIDFGAKEFIALLKKVK